MADVELPGIGRVNRQWVVAGGAVVITIVGVAWWRSRSSGQVEVVPDSTTGSDTGSNEYSNPNPVYSDSGTSALLAPTTDAEWAQRVTDKLTWFEPGYLSAILGKYLARQTLTTAEAEVVRTAWAYLGHPPGNQQILPVTTASTPGTTTPDPAPVTPAPVTPVPAAPAVRYVTVVKYTTRNPPWNSTLSGIAGHESTSVATLLKLNPSIKNANLIYPGQQIRVR